MTQQPDLHSLIEQAFDLPAFDRGRIDRLPRAQRDQAAQDLRRTRLEAALAPAVEEIAASRAEGLALVNRRLAADLTACRTQLDAVRELIESDDEDDPIVLVRADAIDAILSRDQPG